MKSFTINHNNFDWNIEISRQKYFDTGEKYIRIIIDGTGFSLFRQFKNNKIMWYKEDSRLDDDLKLKIDKLVRRYLDNIAFE